MIKLHHVFGYYGEITDNLVVTYGPMRHLTSGELMRILDINIRWTMMGAVKDDVNETSSG